MKSHRPPPRLALGLAALTIVLAVASSRAATIYPHIQNVSAIPGGQGNGTVFTGSVCWIGTLSGGACFPE